MFDTSTLVSVPLRRDGKPARALWHALRRDTVAMSPAILMELHAVVLRPRLARAVDSRLLTEMLEELGAQAAMIEPDVRVTDCRDAKDDKVLELALAAKASVIVSSDDDLLILDPWRGIRILSPAGYLAAAGVE